MFLRSVVLSTCVLTSSLLKRDLQMLASDDLKKSHILIYANKQDVKGAMTAAEITETLNLTSIKEHQWHIQVSFVSEDG